MRPLFRVCWHHLCLSFGQVFVCNRCIVVLCASSQSCSLPSSHLCLFVGLYFCVVVCSACLFLCCGTGDSAWLWLWLQGGVPPRRLSNDQTTPSPITIGTSHASSGPLMGLTLGQVELVGGMHGCTVAYPCVAKGSAGADHIWQPPWAAPTWEATYGNHTLGITSSGGR